MALRSARKAFPAEECTAPANSRDILQGLIKVLKEEVQCYTTNTFQRMIGDYLARKQLTKPCKSTRQLSATECSA